MTLRRVDPTAKRGIAYRALAAAASSPPATWLSRQRIWSAAVWRIDPLLLRLTRGRLGTGLLLPTALLQTRGARSGLRRSNAVIYFHDGDLVTIVASKAGREGNPAWFHNVCADPEVLLGGVPCRASLVTDAAERERLWRLADMVFPAFAVYRDRAAAAGREIPILQLRPTATRASPQATRPLADRLELAAPALAALAVRLIGVLPEPIRRRVLQSAFERAREAFDRGDIEAVMALFADDVEYVVPPPLGGQTIHGRQATLDFWHEVFARFQRSSIENLSLEEAAPGRFVRRARLCHEGGPDGGSLDYAIRQTTVLEAGRVVRQVNELDTGLALRACQG